MTTIENNVPPAPPVRMETADNSLHGHFVAYMRKLRGGDTGALPGIVGLIIACLIFGYLRPNFLSANNLANLFNQGAQYMFIAMGLVFVLLLGEIDLSAGFTSGVCAAVMAILVTSHGWPWYLGILAAIVTGVVIGVLLGVMVAKVRVPSFVVTLAAFLALQGVQLKLLHDGNSVSIFDNTIRKINSASMSTWAGWLMLVLLVGGYLAIQLNRVRSRKKRGLVTDPPALIAIKVGSLAVIGGLGTWALNLNRSLNNIVTLSGVPIIVPIILIVFLALTFLLSRTAYGRHLYAVGGNAEAARRAGIRVDRIRISAFIICSTLAAISGIASASRQTGVDSNLGGSDVLLFSVGAAVIGGTSLFGGRGRVFDAILGGAVITVVSNGMDALSVSAGVKYIVTGFVLLAAATIDAITRRRSTATGR